VKKEDLRHQLFIDGASAFHSVRPDIARQHPELLDAYVCPLCLGAFPESALATRPPRLTIEHVPPRNQSGPFLKLLTCHSCNSRAGTELDSHLDRRTRLRRIGAPGAPAERIQISLAGEHLQGQLYHDEKAGAPRFEVSGRFNDPISLDRVITALRKPGNWEAQAQSVVSYNKRRVRVALLRVGYLVAFAELGYSYAFTTNLEPIRAQIQQPKEDLLPGPFLLRNGYTVELDRFDGRAFLESTTEPRCIAVAINGESIFLPARGGDSAALYTELDQRPEPIPMTFRVLDGWPTRPAYRTDST